MTPLFASFFSYLSQAMSPTISDFFRRQFSSVAVHDENVHDIARSGYSNEGM